MENKEAQIDIQKEFRQRQEKLIYYLIALSVSAIAFSIYKTTGQPLKKIQIPLGIAIICWSLSIYCGLKFMKYVISNLYANNEYFQIVKGKNKDIGNNPELIKAGVKGFRKAMKINEKRMKILYNFHNLLFYSGIVFFILWHIIEMYFIT